MKIFEGLKKELEKNLFSNYTHTEIIKMILKDIDIVKQKFRQEIINIQDKGMTATTKRIDSPIDKERVAYYQGRKEACDEVLELLK